MSKQTFSIFQIFALYFPFCMRPYDARSSVTLEKLGFVVREPQSHLELTYFLPKISAFMLISGNWANVDICPNNPIYVSLSVNSRLVQIDYKFILSSIAACQWERCLGGSDEATVEELVHCEDKYLERYLPSDREKVKMIQKKLEQKYS